MREPCATGRVGVLAVDGDRCWRVRRRPDGALELDTDHTVLLLSAAEFRVVAWLTATASASGDTYGLLAKAGGRRLVHRCGQSGRYTLMFGRMLLRFAGPDFQALAALCGRATRAIGSMREPEIYAAPPAPRVSAN